MLILDLAYFVALIVASPWWLAMALVRPGFRAGMLRRFRPPRITIAGSGSIWLHGSSAGEIDLLRPLVAQLENQRDDFDIVISAFAYSGFVQAKKIFPQHHVIYFPAEFSPISRYLFSRLRPLMVVLVESEFWPNFIATAHSCDIPVAVINGKMSEKSCRLHQRTRLVPWALRKVSLFAVQTEAHAERFARLGIDRQRIRVTGNMKYDLSDAGDGSALREELRARHGIEAGQKVWIGGSLHDGEDEAVALVHRRLVDAGHDLRLVIAPRYVADAAEAQSVLARHGLRGVQKSVHANAKLDDANDVLLLDTIGDLKRYYAMADLAYVGGSLTYRGSNKGGHNLMEPAILGVVPLFGPYNFSFAETVSDLLDNGAGVLVRDTDSLAEAMEMLLDNPDHSAKMGVSARNVILGNRGATEKNYSLLLSLLPAAHEAVLTA